FRRKCGHCRMSSSPVLEPGLGALSVRGESFEFGEFSNGRQRFLQRGPIVFNETCSPLELVNGQSGKRSARASGRERMAWSGDVIAQNCRRVGTKKNRAGGDNLLRQATRVARQNLAMFRSQSIRQDDGLVQGLDLN